jgi:tetratricopeptide (TPR) repeat protein
MLSKGSVVGLPVVILLCIWWLHKAIVRRDILRSIPFFAVSAVMSVVEIWFQYNRAIGEDVVRSDSFLSRLAGAGWAVWFYLYKAVLPIHLTFIYPRWKVDPADWVSYVPGLLLVILLALAWRHRRSWGGPVFFALSYYVVMLLPVLGFFNIYFMRYSLVADHYQYVSIIGLISFAAAVSYGVLGRLGLPGANTAKALGVLVVAIFAIFTWQQCYIYTNIETLWLDTLQKVPNSWIAHNEIGLICKERGRFDEAMDHYRKAVQIKPDYVEAYNNLGNIFQFRRRFDEAVECYRKALKFVPDSAETHNNFGAALQKQGKLDEAINHFRVALKTRPDFVEALNNLGFALQSQEKTDEAISYYRHALKVRPLSAEVHNNMGIALVAKGKYDEAVTHYRQALRIDPNYAGVYHNLGQTLELQGKFDEAAENFAHALRIRPDFAEAHYNLARNLSMAGKFEDALAHYRRAIKLKPDYIQALSGLAWILAAHPDPNIYDANEAVILAERAAKLTNYGDAKILSTLSAAYAAKGRFSEAIETAQKALNIATAGRNDRLADFIRRQLEMYKQGKFLE